MGASDSNTNIDKTPDPIFWEGSEDKSKNSLPDPYFNYEAIDHIINHLRIEDIDHTIKVRKGLIMLPAETLDILKNYMDLVIKPRKLSAFPGPNAPGGPTGPMGPGRPSA